MDSRQMIAVGAALAMPGRRAYNASDATSLTTLYTSDAKLLAPEGEPASGRGTENPSTATA